MELNRPRFRSSTLSPTDRRSRASYSILTCKTVIMPHRFLGYCACHVVISLQMVTSIIDITCSFLKIFIETKPCYLFRTALGGRRDYTKESRDGVCFQEADSFAEG